MLNRKEQLELHLKNIHEVMEALPPERKESEWNKLKWVVEDFENELKDIKHYESFYYENIYEQCGEPCSCSPEFMGGVLIVAFFVFLIIFMH